jgi:uncharacterized protein YqeY
LALKEKIQEDVKAAMRAGDKFRVTTLRMLVAAIKQREVDERIEADDALVLQITEKLIKQRREAAKQYQQAGREELATNELSEAEMLKAYLPEPLAADELATLIDAVISETGAASLRDMGKVMSVLRERAQGRADMGELSKQVKARLAG